MTGYPIPATLPTTPPLPPREPEPVEDLWEPYCTAGLHRRDDHTPRAQMKTRYDREGADS